MEKRKIKGYTFLKRGTEHESECWKIYSKEFYRFRREQERTIWFLSA